MAELSEEKRGIDELLEKIPPEKCWEITTKALWRFIVLRGDKTIAPELGKDEGVIAPVLGAEKWKEINDKIYDDAARQMFQGFKEAFNIPVEDAIGAAKLVIVSGTLQTGPEYTPEIVEATPERAVVTTTGCLIWDRYEEFEVNPEHRACDPACERFFDGGLKAVNPKLTFKHTRIMPWGDPYCKWLIKFKEE